jgi:hypothetical protein
MGYQSRRLYRYPVVAGVVVAEEEVVVDSLSNPSVCLHPDGDDASYPVAVAVCDDPYRSVGDALR